jgi:hypothetical protein
LTNYGERMSAQEFQAFQQDAGTQQQQINVRAAASRFTFK